MRKTLAGRRVVVTRSEGEGGRLSEHLAALGASLLHWPVLQFLPPLDDAPLRRAAAHLDHYDWVVFSSPRAVDAFVSAAGRPPGRARVASVGGATSAALDAQGWPVHLEAEPARGAALVAALSDEGCSGSRCLFPASAIARPTIPAGLESLGAEVEQVIAYRTVPSDLDAAACGRLIESGSVDAVTFASPSAVDGLALALGEDLFHRLLTEAAVVAIGPTTAEALERVGHAADAVAETGHLAALAAAVEAVLTSPS